MAKMTHLWKSNVENLLQRRFDFTLEFNSGSSGIAIQEICPDQMA